MIEELDVDSFISQECEICGGNVYACYCLDEEFEDEWHSNVYMVWKYGTYFSWLYIST